MKPATAVTGKVIKVAVRRQQRHGEYGHEHREGEEC